MEEPLPSEWPQAHSLLPFSRREAVENVYSSVAVLRKKNSFAVARREQLLLFNADKMGSCPPSVSHKCVLDEVKHVASLPGPPALRKTNERYHT